MDVRFHAAATHPIFAMSLRNDLGQAVFATSTAAIGVDGGSFEAGDTATVRFRFDNWLAPGRHRLMATVAREGLGADLSTSMLTAQLSCWPIASGGGSVDFPHSIEIQR